MSRTTDILLTALAPAIWGSTYLVTTEALPAGYPVTIAALRALPAGLLLLFITRSLPPRAWLGRVFLLGGLNFALFWSLLFVAAYRLPGGVAATLGALQALMVLGLARFALGNPVCPASVIAAVVGGLRRRAAGAWPRGRVRSDRHRRRAGRGALSMAAGTVFTRKWQPPVPPLTFAAWQLSAGGLLLLPLALLIEPVLPSLSALNLAGLVWIGLIGAAFTYWLWFRGVARIEPAAVSMLGMMSPVTAVALGWIWLGEGLSSLQVAGALVVLGSVWLGQAAARRAPRANHAKPHSKNRE